MTAPLSLLPVLASPNGKAFMATGFTSVLRPETAARKCGRTFVGDARGDVRGDALGECARRKVVGDEGNVGRGEGGGKADMG